AWLCDRTGLLQRAMLPKTPEVMAERAREVLGRLLPEGAAADEAFSFEWDAAYLRQVAIEDRSPMRWLRMGERPFAPFYFYFRQTPGLLAATNRDGMIRPDDPPVDVSGMAEVVLDPPGQMLSFLSVPMQREAAAGPWPEPDWGALLRETVLDP